MLNALSLRRKQSFVGLTNGKIDITDQKLRKRTEGYVFILSCIAHWASLLANGKSIQQEKLKIGALSLFIPLYDDLMDDYGLSHEEAMEGVNTQSYPNGFLYKKELNWAWQNLKIQVPDWKQFCDFLERGGVAQNQSLKQQKGNLKRNALLDITIKKGGEFNCLSWCVFTSFSKEEAVVIYKIGTMMQFLNDLFDVYKDLQQETQTLFNSEKDLELNYKLFSDLQEEIFDLIGNSKDGLNLKGALSLVFSTGLVCFEQYRGLAKTTGSQFLPSHYSRKQLICDLDIKKNQVKNFVFAFKMLKSRD